MTVVLADHTLEMTGLGVFLDDCFMNHICKIRFNEA